MRRDPSKIDDLDKHGSFKQLEITPRELKQLKYEARKRKWVRRCTRINDYMHGICKSKPIFDLMRSDSLGLGSMPGLLQDELFPASLGKPAREHLLPYDLPRLHGLYHHLRVLHRDHRTPTSRTGGRHRKRLCAACADYNPGRSGFIHHRNHGNVARVGLLDTHLHDCNVLWLLILADVFTQWPLGFFVLLYRDWSGRLH